MLVVAGSLKRSDRGRPEDQVLMRALRDFNIPKIVTDDMPVFMGLIGDLFPALDVPRKRDLDFEKFVKQSIVVRVYVCTCMHAHTCARVCSKSKTVCSAAHVYACVGNYIF